MIKEIISILFKVVKPKNDVVMFSSFFGQYNDNPKYVSEKLHEVAPDIKIYWIIDENRCNCDDIPEYIEPVKSRSLRKFYLQNRAKVLVDNLAGWYNMVVPQSRYNLYKLIKNKKVYNLSTWHGTPRKKIGVEAYEYDERNSAFFSTSDLIICNSDYLYNIFRVCYQDKVPFLITGTPRNDILINITDKQIIGLKEKLGLNQRKRTVLYAPTYRSIESGYDYEDNFDFLYGLDINNLIKVLHKKFGGEWQFVFRGHQFDQSRSDFKSFVKNIDIDFVDGNRHDDMAEYLSVSDILITDYSSSMFDFAITGRPCFLYTPDREIYENSLRGVYEIDLPYNNNDSNQELFNSIYEFNMEYYNTKNKKFLKTIGMREDGNASSRVVDIILSKLKTDKLGENDE